MGFVLGILIGACACGLETCLWLHDHIRHEEKIKTMGGSIMDLKKSVINLMEDKKELAKENDRLYRINENLCKDNDRLRRTMQAKGWTDELYTKL